MGRGGGGGGGRSSGGGGSRSSGGRMSSSGRGGGSSFRSSSSCGGSSGYHSGGGHVHYSNHYYGGRGYAPRSGCLTSILTTFFLILACVFLLRSSFGAGGSSITKSTVQREPLEASAVITTDYYADELGWIGNPTKLTVGMKNFFKQTGVQPFLFITDTVNGTKEPTSDDMDAYVNQLYEELFEDEGHILILFHEYYSGQYSSWYVCGKQAKTVMDQEACDILLDYIDHYYYSDLKDEEMFSTAFDKAGDRIMTVTKSPLPTIIVAVCAVAIVIVAFLWWKKAKKQKNIEAAHTERILNTNLGTIGGQESDGTLSNLEEKYK